MAYEKVVAVFDKAEHADNAVRALQAAGFPATDISAVNNQGLPTNGTSVREPKLWKRIFGNDIEHHEASVYGDTVHSGGTVVTLRAADHQVAKATEILHDHSPVDVPERAASLGLPVAPVAARAEDSEVIRLAEEQLNVGKRQVETGTTRVRRFVTERPVEAQVTLHEEHAEVVRRAISDPNYLADIDWSDKTIEVRETAEQAVVSKSSHLAEELVIRKGSSDHVETVHDTVRRQQAEVERVAATSKSA
jgi:uncharacterized protein (TIGR02271 family)